MELLECGCRIMDGQFMVGDWCKHCKECNAMVEIHPFGNKRLHDFA